MGYGYLPPLQHGVQLSPSLTAWGTAISLPYSMGYGYLPPLQHGVRLSPSLTAWGTAISLPYSMGYGYLPPLQHGVRLSPSLTAWGTAISLPYSMGYGYLPYSMGYCILLVLGVQTLSRARTTARGRVAASYVSPFYLGLLLVGFFTARTIVRNPVWHTRESLFR